MTQRSIRTRVASLEAWQKAFPAQRAFAPVPDHLAARIIAAKAAGSFPASLSNADLEAIVALGDGMGAV